MPPNRRIPFSHRIGAGVTIARPVECVWEVKFLRRAGQDYPSGDIPRGLCGRFRFVCLERAWQSSTQCRLVVAWASSPCRFRPLGIVDHKLHEVY